jgi:hypothetical protein
MDAAFEQLSCKLCSDGTIKIKSPGTLCIDIGTSPKQCSDVKVQLYLYLLVCLLMQGRAVCY